MSTRGTRCRWSPQSLSDSAARVIQPPAGCADAKRAKERLECCEKVKKQMEGLCERVQDCTWCATRWREGRAKTGPGHGGKAAGGANRRSTTFSGLGLFGVMDWVVLGSNQLPTSQRHAPSGQQEANQGLQGPVLLTLHPGGDGGLMKCRRYGTKRTPLLGRPWTSRLSPVEASPWGSKVRAHPESIHKPVG